MFTISRLLFILPVITFLILLHHPCEGYSVITNQKQAVSQSAKTFSEQKDEGIEWKIWDGETDYAAISIVFWPVILILVSVLVIPTALVMLVIFAIPALTPAESGGEGRDISEVWDSVYLTQNVLNGAEECLERLSCELAKVANKYAYPLANRIQDKIANIAVLSSGTKARLSRSFEVAAGLGRNEGCIQFTCKPWKNISSTNNTISRVSGTLNTFINSTDSIIDQFTNTLGKRFVFRKKKPKTRTQVMRVK